MSGLKYDSEKIRMELVPPEADISLARVLTFGAKKYGDNTWQNLDNAIPRYLGALKRHLALFQQDIYGIDEESGLYHIEHVLWNAMALTFFVFKAKCKNLGTMLLKHSKNQMFKEIQRNRND